MIAAGATREFRPVTSDDLYEAMAARMVEVLRDLLAKAGPGQRLRVTALPESVIDRVCSELQQDKRWVARALAQGESVAPWRATATKLIELRNTLREPLLVFVPPGARNAAEDSLDIATFTELSLGQYTSEVVDYLFQQLPSDLVPSVRDAIEYLRLERQVVDADQVMEYVLAVVKNGANGAAAGGCLFVFGLVPDFALFDRQQIRSWLSRNVNVRDLMAEVSQPLQSRIRRLPIEPNSLQGDLFAFFRTRQSAAPREWAETIACDRTYQKLSLDQWPFSDQIETNKVRIVLEPLGLPMQVPDEVGGTTAMRVLDLDTARRLKVSFRPTPPPSQVGNWRSFRIQILAVDSSATTVSWESNSYPKPSGRNRLISRSIKANELQSLEEGTYFLRVDAFDQDGTLLTDERRIDSDAAPNRAENESEYFLVTRKGTEIEPPSSRAVPMQSLPDAWTLAATRALSESATGEITSSSDVTGAWQEAVTAAPRGDTHFALTGHGVVGLAVVVPGLLRRLEFDVLSQPERMGCFQVNLTGSHGVSDAVIVRRQLPEITSTPELQQFVSERSKVFGAILAQHSTRAESADTELQTRQGLVEVCDLVAMEEEIREYARSYVRLVGALIASKAGSEYFVRLAQLDATEVRWRASARDPGRALIMGPTHPLRLLWHAQHATVCQKTIESWQNGERSAADWRQLLEQLRRGISPTSLPIVLFDQKCRPYVENGLLTSHWTLYLPDRRADEPAIDTAAVRDTARRVLGVRGRSRYLASIGSSQIARRAFEYLEQHPYVEQLHVNVFNAGDGEVVTDALRQLESLRLQVDRGKRDAPPLRYCVQLLGTSEHLDILGESLEYLLDPERQVGEDDEFTLASANHLFPKLVFGRNTVEDFLRSPADFNAHISIFLEQFEAHGRLGSIGGLRRGSFVEGLVQEPETSLETSASHYGWFRGLKPGMRPGAGETEQLLKQVLESAQGVQAAAATGSPAGPDIAPVIALQLDPETQALIKQVHDVSDWVLTVDRNLGIEYFDSPASARDSGFLLDFAPEYLQEDQQRILLTTRSSIELASIVLPSMARFGLETQPGDEVLIVEALRSLSGRLALRLLASPNHAAEVVGLLLARWLLERADLLHDSIVIPLDAHLGWFRTSGESDGDLTQRRADLLFVSFDEPRRLLDMIVVEVKLRESLTESSRATLYEAMRLQARDTERRLRDLFDPDAMALPRADFLLRAKELSTALSFYLARGFRYGLIQRNAVEAGRRLLEKLDAGYAVSLSSVGVIFERQATGSYVEGGVAEFPIHRFGLDVAQGLLEDARPTPSAALTPTDMQAGSTSVGASLNKSLDSFRLAVSSKKTLHRERHVAAARPVSSETKKEEPGDPRGHVSAAPQESPTEPVRRDEKLRASAPLIDGRGVPAPVAAGLSSLDPRAQTPDTVILGATERTPQFGIIGRSGGDLVGIDLTGCNTISLFGVQGFGKSYTMGVVAEMASKHVARINALPSPLATVIFHYHKSDAYAPEYLAAIAPNNKKPEIERLKEEYGADPAGLDDVLLLTPPGKVEIRRSQFSGVEVMPIQFSSRELGAESWKFLLGAYDNESLYMRQLVAMMRRYRGDLTIGDLEREVAATDFAPGVRRLAEDRLALAKPYIDDSASLVSVLRPGRTVVVDLRDEWIEKDEALGLFVVMLRIFATATYQGRSFNKLVVFDEAHKYITESALIGQVVETIREMRHQATSVMIASQDPLSVPRAVIELTSVLLLHRMTSPQWLRHLKGAITALEGVSEGQLAALQPGEALAWAQRATERRFSARPQKILVRPRFTMHGGGTKTAVSGTTIR